MRFPCKKYANTVFSAFPKDVANITGKCAKHVRGMFVSPVGICDKRGVLLLQHMVRGDVGVVGLTSHGGLRGVIGKAFIKHCPFGMILDPFFGYHTHLDSGATWGGHSANTEGETPEGYTERRPKHVCNIFGTS